MINSNLAARRHVTCQSQASAAGGPVSPWFRRMPFPFIEFLSVLSDKLSMKMLFEHFLSDFQLIRALCAHLRGACWVYGEGSLTLASVYVSVDVRFVQSRQNYFEFSRFIPQLAIYITLLSISSPLRIPVDPPSPTRMLNIRLHFQFFVLFSRSHLILSEIVFIFSIDRTEDENSHRIGASYGQFQ